MSDFMLNDEHIGQKIFEIEEERVITIKTRVVAEDRDKAFEKYLACTDTIKCEEHDCKDNGSDVINHYAKDYGGYKNTTQVGEVIKERDFPDDDEDDSYSVKESYETTI